MAQGLAVAALLSVALLVAAPGHAQEAQEEPPDMPGLYATVLTAVKAEKPNRKLVLDVCHYAGRRECVSRLREDHVRAMRDRTTVVHAVCDSYPEGRREQPCGTPGLKDGAFFVNVGPVTMQPNGEVVVSVQLTTPEQPGVSEIRGVTYVLRRWDGEWYVDRIADRWII